MASASAWTKGIVAGSGSVNATVHVGLTVEGLFARGQHRWMWFGFDFARVFATPGVCVGGTVPWLDLDRRAVPSPGGE